MDIIMRQRGIVQACAACQGERPGAIEVWLGRLVEAEVREQPPTRRIWRGLSTSGGLQYIDHPGYNRGPVLVEMLRVHLDF
jgi:hypothetical protein